jgi:hypothetical protein
LIKLISSNPNNPLIDAYEDEIRKLKITIKIVEEKLEHIQTLFDTNLEHQLDKAFRIFNQLYNNWLKGDYEQKVTIQKLLLNANVEYGRKENFGTPENCYILSFLRTFNPKKDQNFHDVDITRIPWNTVLESLVSLDKMFPDEKTFIDEAVKIAA